MAYDDPFRLRVLKAVTAALEQITPANGYNHDLSGAVFRGRAEFGETDPLPMVSVLDARDPAEVLAPDDPSATESAGTWTLMLQGFALDDHQNPTDPAERLLADVRRRLAEEKARRDDSGWLSPFGLGTEHSPVNNVRSIEFGFGQVRPPDGVISEKAYFWLLLTLDVTEDAARPFE